MEQKKEKGVIRGKKKEKREKQEERRDTIKINIKKFGSTVSELFYPRHCPICDRVLPPRTQLLPPKIQQLLPTTHLLPPSTDICPDCAKIPQIVKPPNCYRCGKHLQKEGEIYCFDCLRNPKSFERGFSLYEYYSVRDSVSTFKNMGRPDYAAFYGRRMGEFLRLNWRGRKPDALIPIPLHESKMRQRGYNQSALLAEEIAKVTGIPVREDILFRPKKSKVQKSLGRTERQKNMKKAFQLHKNDVKLKTVILVDDVYTTGSTIEAAASVLKSAGVEAVYFITIATGTGLAR